MGRFDRDFKAGPANRVVVRNGNFGMGLNGNTGDPAWADQNLMNQNPLMDPPGGGR
jgi:hypothetical protein